MTLVFAAMAKSVEVNIMGQKLQIRSDSEAAYVEEIAAHVDKKIREILARTKSVASTQVVILAAMNMADEFFKYKQGVNVKKDAVAKKIESMIEHIDLRL